MSEDKMDKLGAYYTYDPEYRLYYFAPSDRAAPPYRKQIEVRAIIDIAADGTLAGVELIDGMPPAPDTPKARPEPSQPRTGGV